MRTITLRGQADADGILHLKVPLGIGKAEWDVIVIVERLDPPDPAEWLAFIDRTAGSLADDPIERPPQGEYETRDRT